MPVDADQKQDKCGPNQYSLEIWNTGASGSKTKTGLSLYYYKTKWDWDNRKNRVFYSDYCGDIIHGEIAEMGHGDHIWTNELYGVGIMAHGDDAYRLKRGEIFQNFGNANFGNWINIWGFDDMDIW